MRMSPIFFGGDRHICPICDNKVKVFLKKYGKPWRCPICFSEPRHRLTYLYLRDYTDLFDNKPKKLLHVAPELCLMDAFKKHTYLDYLSGDLSSSLAMVKMDLRDIKYPDDHFDVIYCSHILEHIQEDRVAMKELYRVLKPKGWAIIMVPLGSGQTDEDPNIVTPQQRREKYGHPEHVRKYGKADFKNRLEESGFSVTVDPMAENLSNETRLLYGIGEQDVYLCRKFHVSETEMSE